MERSGSSWSKKRICEYQTTNPSMAHFARPLLDLLTSKFSDGKISYWFDWRIKDIPKGFQGVTLCGDRTASPIHSKIDELRMHFGMWKNAYIIEPKDEKNGDDIFWQYGFKIPDSKPEQMSVCSLLLEGPVKVLVGPTPLTVFGMYPYNPYKNEIPREIPLQTWGTCKRNLQLDIPLI